MPARCRSRLTHRGTEGLHRACNCAHPRGPLCAVCRPCAGLWPGQDGEVRQEGHLAGQAGGTDGTPPPRLDRRTAHRPHPR
eukprot:482631-Prymnesium_polylepis.1